VRGYERAQFLRERMGEAFLILTSAVDVASSHPSAAQRLGARLVRTVA